MPEAQNELRRGRLVWALVRDPRGHEKERTVVILTPTADFSSVKPLLALAVTTSFSEPAPADHIVLPWHPQGRVLTRLRRRSAVVVSWVVQVMPGDVLQLQGDVPMRLMNQILARLDSENK